jgi:hypothetical protein
MSLAQVPADSGVAESLQQPSCSAREKRLYDEGPRLSEPKSGHSSSRKEVGFEGDSIGFGSRVPDPRHGGRGRVIGGRSRGNGSATSNSQRQSKQRCSKARLVDPLMAGFGQNRSTKMDREGTGTGRGSCVGGGSKHPRIEPSSHHGRVGQRRG